MKPKVIKSRAEHAAALAHVESLMDAPPGSSQESELELWSLLVEKYEDEHFPVAAPDPVEAIRFRMEQENLRPRDLVPLLKSKSKVSEVLNRKRPLSLAMIRSLSAGLNIPAALLLQASPRKFSRRG